MAHLWLQLRMKYLTIRLVNFILVAVLESIIILLEHAIHDVFVAREPATSHILLRFDRYNIVGDVLRLVQIVRIEFFTVRQHIFENRRIVLAEVYLGTLRNGAIYRVLYILEAHIVHLIRALDDVLHFDPR